MTERIELTGTTTEADAWRYAQLEYRRKMARVGVEVGPMDIEQFQKERDALAKEIADKLRDFQERTGARSVDISADLTPTSRIGDARDRTLINDVILETKF